MIILMGVSGTGKSTIGKLLADRLDLSFYDADDFHPPGNIDKLSKGVALTDFDRQPWLKKLGTNIIKWQAKGGGVLACSALKESYRKLLTTIPGDQITFVHLKGDFELIKGRLAARTSHFFDPSLLKSQYRDLEDPTLAIQISVNQSQEEIIQEILNKMNQKTSFGIIGMGVMGQNLAINMAGNGTRLSVYNRHVPGKEENIAADFANAQSHLSIQGYDALKAFVDSIATPRNILLMIQAGSAVDITIDELIPLLGKDDLIIDGGNSNYLDTNRRDQHLAKHDINFIGAGISGGEEGARKGPSIMPGGSRSAYRRIAPILDGIAAKDINGNPCCAYVGPEGSGHFVKMVHNGIEYAEMQLLAEVYELMRNGLSMAPNSIAETLESWKNQGHDSYLLEITINILRKQEDGELLLDKILDAASQKGTGGWSTEAAIKLGSPLNTIADAVMARNLSAQKTLRVSANKSYGEIKKRIETDPDDFINALEEAYHAARVINHAIGFDMINEASDQYNWSLNLSEIARIWTNGCIIRSELMSDAVSYFGKCNRLLLHPKIVDTLKLQQSQLAMVVGQALAHGYPTPVFSSAASFFLGYVNGRSSANLLQAQRDYFGAHTYKRVDQPQSESFHTEWISS
ncbi:MAG: NADP-dependent phosphogluconate dehydrogenase [Reichenbachiella sp.]|uniref:NADP-dependent phosphogluconate dehydrogenase n=1 Tax=Reichenbachiella sp. TaxID=2184521 RepID=UPI003265BAAC